MPLLNRRQYPDVGEVVVGTIKELHDYGAYLELDEFNGLRAFLPWIEVSNRSFRSIDDVLKVNERVAVKVIRVNKSKGQVDVSLKKVTDDERKRKMTWWKRTQKAVNIVLMIAKGLKKSEKQAYSEVIWKLEDKYGDAMTGLEMAAIEGPAPLVNAGVPQEWVAPLVEAAKKYVEIKRVRLSAVITLKSKEPDGIDRIRKILETVEGMAAGDANISIKVYAIGSPRYRVDIIGVDYKELEDLFNKMQNSVTSLSKELKVESSVEMIKE